MSTVKIPSVWPVLRDVAVHQDRPERADVMRVMAEQQAYLYAKAVRVTPCDPICWNNNPTNQYNSAPLNGVSDRATGQPTDFKKLPIDNPLCKIRVPEPTGYPRRLKVWLYVQLATSACSADIYFFSGRGSPTIGQRLDYAGLGSVLAAWKEVIVTATGPDEITVTMDYVAGVAGAAYYTVEIMAISAFWEPLTGVAGDVTVDTSWTALAQTYIANGKSDSAYVNKWIQRKAVQLLANRPRQVCAKWLSGTWWATSTATSSTVTTVVGRYKVYVGDQVRQLLAYSLGSATSPGGDSFQVKWYVDGVLKDTETHAFGVGYTWSAVAAIDVTANMNSVVEIRVDAVMATSGTAGTRTFRVAGLSLFEDPPTAANLGLPAPDTIPSTFPSVDSSLINSRTPIYADKDSLGKRAGKAQLIKGLVYLASNRVRHLVSDSRYRDVSIANGSADLLAGNTRCYARYKLLTSAGVNRIRVWANVSTMAWTNSGLRVDSYAVVSVNLQTPNTTITSLYYQANKSWLYVGEFSVSGSTGYEINASVISSGGVSATHGTGMINGLMIEEVPLTEAEMASL